MHCGKAENMLVRLDDPRSRIEFERTKELVLRDLAPPQRWTQVIGRLVRVSRRATLRLAVLPPQALR
jgi:hypothetical protein